MKGWSWTCKEIHGAISMKEIPSSLRGTVIILDSLERIPEIRKLIKVNLLENLRKDGVLDPNQWTWDLKKLIIYYKWLRS